MGHYFKNNREKILARSLLVAFLVLLIGFYGALVIPVARSQKILPHISVAGINLAGKDLDHARSLLAYESKHFDQIKIKLKYGQHQFTPSLAQLGIAVDIDQTLEKAYAPTLTRGFWNDLKHHLGLVKPGEIMYKIKVDEKKYDAYFKKLSQFVKRSPQNANLEISGTEIKLIPGKPGLTLTATETRKKIVESLKQGEIKTFALATKKTPPVIQESETKNAQAQAQKWMQTSVTVIVNYDPKAEQTKGDQSFTASGATIGSWIYFEEKDDLLEAKLSNSAINGWVQRIASQATIPAINKRVQVVQNQSKVLSEGKEGQVPNTAGVAAKISQQVKAGGGSITIKTAKIAPAEEVIGGFLLGRFEGKYIEIVLSQQKLYAINGDKLKFTFTISSGRTDMPTPVGNFTIVRKTTWAACRPSPTEYRTCFMPNSMFFTGSGHAIHALPIIDGVQEGMWHLGYRVSHGCVRLAPDAAATLYNWTPMGTPVIVHQ